MMGSFAATPSRILSFEPVRTTVPRSSSSNFEGTAGNVGSRLSLSLPQNSGRKIARRPARLT